MTPGSMVGIVVRAIDDGGLEAALHQTEMFELLDGPHVIATCRLLGVHVGGPRKERVQEDSIGDSAPTRILWPERKAEP